MRLAAGRYIVWNGRLYRFKQFNRESLALSPLPPAPGPSTQIPKSFYPDVQTIGVSARFDGDVVEDLHFEDGGSVLFRLWRSGRHDVWPPAWPLDVLTHVESGRPAEGWAEGRAPLEALSDLTYEIPESFRDFVTPDGYLTEPDDRG